MEAFEALSLCGEVAVAITGFAGVVHVFGTRGDKLSPEVNPALFRMLFTGTISPLGLIAIALVLGAAGVPDEPMWRICSACHLASLGLFTAMNSRSRESRAFMSAPGARIVVVGAALVALLSLSNAAFGGAFWPFLVVICWSIGLGLFAFVNLIFSGRGP